MNCHNLTEYRIVDDNDSNKTVNCHMLWHNKGHYQDILDK